MGRPSKTVQQENNTSAESAGKTLVFDHAVKYNGKFYAAGLPVPVQ